MEWVAPQEKDEASETLEKRLWDAADQFRANSGKSGHDSHWKLSRKWGNRRVFTSA